MMRKLYIFGLIALAGIIIGFAWAEQITLTTYYPAPYGVYREFTTTGNTYLATDSGNVGIGTTEPQAKLDISGDGNTIIVPRKSTAGDPSGINGMVYYNTSSNKFRVYENGEWRDLVGGGGFGNWTNVTAAASGGSAQGPTTTDGFVMASLATDVIEGDLKGYTDGSNPPTTLRCFFYHFRRQSASGFTRSSIMMPVREGDYWRVTGAATIYWIPFGQ